MPAARLPWFRFWVGATAHAKARTLSDGEFRTWIELLDLCAQQKWRGRFTSKREALGLVRRPPAHLDALIRAGLVDVDPLDKHLTMHDWDHWQRWREGDSDDHPNDHTNDTGTTHERPPDQHVIDPATTNGTTRESHVNVPTSSSREDVRLKDERRRDVETLDEEKKDVRVKNGGTAPIFGAPQRGNPRVAEVIDAFRKLRIEPIMNGRDRAAIKESNAPPGLIAEVFDAVSRREYGDDFMRKRLSVHEAVDWVGGYVEARLDQAAGDFAESALDQEKARLCKLGWSQPAIERGA
jgi:hypothetical protein